MKLDRFTFEIVGVSPLMMHNAASMLDRDDTETVTAKKVKKTPEQLLKEGLYINGDGDLYLPSAAFRNALLKGGKGRKIGKVGASTVLTGAVFPLADETCLHDPKSKKHLTEKNVVMDKRSAVNRNCNPPARIIAIRPKVMSWGCSLEVEIDTGLVSQANVLEVLNIAGRIVGVGSFRPENKGTFGRFEASLK